MTGNPGYSGSFPILFEIILSEKSSIFKQLRSRCLTIINSSRALYMRQSMYLCKPGHAFLRILRKYRRLYMLKIHYHIPVLALALMGGVGFSAQEASALPVDHYAQSSRMAQGKWVKIRNAVREQRPAQENGLLVPEPGACLWLWRTPSATDAQRLHR